MTAATEQRPNPTLGDETSVPVTGGLPWVQSTAPERLSNGLVLAMHCVPADVDPAVEAFWSALAGALAQRGHTLVLLSTTAVRDPALQVIDMPFELTAFTRHFANHPTADEAVSEAAVQDAMAWYGCGADAARDNLCLAQGFLRDLLDTLRPAAVLGWQGLNPLTRVLRDIARAGDVPYWSGERGWVRNTLMFDLGGAHLLGEAGTSLAATRQRRRYRPAPGLLAALRSRARGAAALGRYAASQRVGRAELRQRLGLPADAKVAVLFTHGEPGMNAMGSPAVREMHDLSPALLQQRLDVVSAALLARGHWLLVQEHPFNEAAGRCLRLPDSCRVLAVRENVSSLIDAADVLLFTLATLQFDAVFLDKPLGLLSRSALYRDGTPPFIGDHPGADTFLDSLFDEAAWPARFERLQTDVAFFFEQLLIDIEPEALPAGAAEWANHLAQLQRPLDRSLDARVERFVGQWTVNP
jgi:hypothetical protein